MKPENLFWGVFVLFGIFFAFIGTKIQEQNTRFLETAETTNAQITRFEYEHSADKTRTIVYVEFDVDGQTYSGDLGGEYNATMYVGGDVTIYYNPANPNEFSGPSTNIAGYIFMGFGAVAAIIGIIPIALSFRHSSRVEE